MRDLVYTNPVWPGYFADPFVWRCNDEYFAIGTGENEAEGIAEVSDNPTIFPLLRSPDLVHWREAGTALVRPDAAFGASFWAPEVVFEGGRWLLYYSVGHEDRLHQIRVAESELPLGPYRDVAGLTDPSDCAFAIDPHPFRDVDGRWYLFHARDFLDCGDGSDGAHRAGTALVVHPLQSMTKLADEGRVVARARWSWQRFAANRPMYGRLLDWHTLEGPCVVRRDGRYWCFYSGGCWQTESYGVDYVVADSVLGPWSDDGGGQGPRVLRTMPNRVIGPGHCSVVEAPDGEPLLVYHAWGPDRQARRMCIDALVFGPVGPRSAGPSWTERALHAA
jgi:beta-xylosidase